MPEHERYIVTIKIVCGPRSKEQLPRLLDQFTADLQYSIAEYDPQYKLSIATSTEKLALPRPDEDEPE